MAKVGFNELVFSIHEVCVCEQLNLCLTAIIPFLKPHSFIVIAIIHLTPKTENLRVQFLILQRSHSLRFSYLILGVQICTLFRI